MKNYFSYLFRKKNLPPCGHTVICTDKKCYSYRTFFLQKK